MEGPVDPLFYKSLGSIIGTIAGLAYVKPRNGRDAVARIIVSVLVGVTFAFWPLDYFEWPGTPERWTAGGFLMAGAAWPAAGVLLKWVSSKASS